MNPESWPIRIIAGMISTASALIGFIWALLALLFWGNFRFENSWHCFVFGSTMIAPCISLGTYLPYLRNRSWKAFGFLVAGAAVILFIFFLWSAPSSRGLIH